MHATAVQGESRHGGGGIYASRYNVSNPFEDSQSDSSSDEGGVANAAALSGGSAQDNDTNWKNTLRSDISRLQTIIHNVEGRMKLISSEQESQRAHFQAKLATVLKTEDEEVRARSNRAADLSKWKQGIDAQLAAITKTSNDHMAAMDGLWKNVALENKRLSDAIDGHSMRLSKLEKSLRRHDNLLARALEHLPEKNSISALRAEVSRQEEKYDKVMSSATRDMAELRSKISMLLKYETGKKNVQRSTRPLRVKRSRGRIKQRTSSREDAFSARLLRIAISSPMSLGDCDVHGKEFLFEKQAARSSSPSTSPYKSPTEQFVASPPSNRSRIPSRGKIRGEGAMWKGRKN
eukprot:g5311.t1